MKLACLSVYPAQGCNMYIIKVIYEYKIKAKETKNMKLLCLLLSMRTMFGNLRGK